MSYSNNTSGYKITTMEDFNDTEQDWFSDVVDEPNKAAVFSQIDSPGGGIGGCGLNNRADSRLSDFTALNVPVDDSFFGAAEFGGGAPLDASSSYAHNTHANNNNNGVGQFVDGAQQMHHEMPAGTSTTMELRGGNNHDNVADISFPQPFQQTPTRNQLQQQPQLVSQTPVLNLSQFDLSTTFDSPNFVECQPSTSSAPPAASMMEPPQQQTAALSQQQQHSQQQQWQHSMSQQQLQGSSAYDNISQQQQMTNGVPSSQHQQQIFRDSSAQQSHQQYYQLQQMSDPQQQQMPNAPQMSEQSQQLPQQQQHQPPSHFSASAVEVNTDYHHQVIQPVQIADGQQFYPNQPPQQLPFIAQNDSQTMYQTQLASSSQQLQSSNDVATADYNMMLQSQQQPSQQQMQPPPQPAMLHHSQLQQQPLLHQSQALYASTTNESILLPPTQQQQQPHFFAANSQPPATSSQDRQQSAVSQNVPAQTPSARTAQNAVRRAPRLTGRRQSKQNLLYGGLSSSNLLGGAASATAAAQDSVPGESSFTLGAVMQKIFASTGDMNAAVRFTPELNNEFLKIVNEHNQLSAQQKNGVNLSDEIRAVEERIVKLLSAAEPTTQTNAMNKTVGTPDSASSKFSSPSVIPLDSSGGPAPTTASLPPKTARGKGRRPPASNFGSQQNQLSTNVQSMAGMTQTSSNDALVQVMPVAGQQSSMMVTASSTNSMMVAQNSSYSSVENSSAVMMPPNSFQTISAMNDSSATSSTGMILGNNVIHSSMPSTNVVMTGSQPQMTSSQLPLQHQQMQNFRSPAAVASQPLPQQLSSQPQASTRRRPKQQRLNARQTQQQPLTPNTFGASKKGQSMVPKFQPIQQQTQMVQQPQQPPQQSQQPQMQPQTVTIVEMHPTLAGQLTAHQLAQIIPSATLNPNGLTTIIVNYQGQQLPIVVSTATPAAQPPFSVTAVAGDGGVGLTDLSAQNGSMPMVAGTQQASDLAQFRLQQPSHLVQSNAQLLSATQGAALKGELDAVHSTPFVPGQTQPIMQSPQLANYTSAMGAAVKPDMRTESAINSASSRNARQKRGGGSAGRAKALTSVAQPLLSTTPALVTTPIASSASSSFDLDDTIARVVCQQASLAGSSTSSSTIRNLMNASSSDRAAFLASASQDTTVGAALQPYSRSQLRRKPRSKAYDTPLRPFPNLTTMNVPVPQMSSSAEPAMIVPKPAPPPLILPSPTELGRKIAEKVQERTSKLKSHYDSIRDSLPSIDYESAFSGKMDCLNRLLPFAFVYEPDFSEDLMERVDHDLLRQSIGLRRRTLEIENKLRNIVLKETTSENVTRHEVNMLLYLDAEYERRQLDEERRKAKENCDDISHKSLLLKEDVSKSDCRRSLMDFEYHDFDPSKYLDISPFSSPLPLKSTAFDDYGPTRSVSRASAQTTADDNDEDLLGARSSTYDDDGESSETDADDSENMAPAASMPAKYGVAGNADWCGGSAKASIPPSVGSLNDEFGYSQTPSPTAAANYGRATNKSSVEFVGVKRNLSPFASATSTLKRDVRDSAEIFVKLTPYSVAKTSSSSQQDNDHKAFLKARNFDGGLELSEEFLPSPSKVRHLSSPLSQISSMISSPGRDAKGDELFQLSTSNFLCNSSPPPNIAASKSHSLSSGLESADGPKAVSKATVREELKSGDDEQNCSPLKIRFWKQNLASAAEDASINAVKCSYESTGEDSLEKASFAESRRTLDEREDGISSNRRIEEMEKTDTKPDIEPFEARLEKKAKKHNGTVKNSKNEKLSELPLTSAMDDSAKTARVPVKLKIRLGGLQIGRNVELETRNSGVNVRETRSDNEAEDAKRRAKEEKRRRKDEKRQKKLLKKQQKLLKLAGNSPLPPTCPAAAGSEDGAESVHSPSHHDSPSTPALLPPPLLEAFLTEKCVVEMARFDSASIIEESRRSNSSSEKKESRISPLPSPSLARRAPCWRADIDGVGGVANSSHKMLHYGGLDNSMDVADIEDKSPTKAKSPKKVNGIAIHMKRNNSHQGNDGRAGGEVGKLEEKEVDVNIVDDQPGGALPVNHASAPAVNTDTTPPIGLGLKLRISKRALFPSTTSAVPIVEADDDGDVPPALPPNGGDVLIEADENGSKHVDDEKKGGRHRRKRHHSSSRSEKREKNHRSKHDDGESRRELRQQPAHSESHSAADGERHGGSKEEQKKRRRKQKSARDDDSDEKLMDIVEVPKRLPMLRIRLGGLPPQPHDAVATAEQPQKTTKDGAIMIDYEQPSTMEESVKNAASEMTQLPYLSRQTSFNKTSPSPLPSSSSTANHQQQQHHLGESHQPTLARPPSRASSSLNMAAESFHYHQTHQFQAHGGEFLGGESASLLGRSSSPSAALIMAGASSSLSRVTTAAPVLPPPSIFGGGPWGVTDGLDLSRFGDPINHAASSTAAGESLFLSSRTLSKTSLTADDVDRLLFATTSKSHAIMETFDANVSLSNGGGVGNSMTNAFQNHNHQYHQQQQQQQQFSAAATVGVEGFGRFMPATTNNITTAAAINKNVGAFGKMERVQFSPCSDDSEDDQLRNRTDQLLTKLKSHV